MRFAFALYRYFPHGGLQCDMMRMAQEALRRGHEVTVFAHQWRGPQPEPGLRVRFLPVRGWSNHAKMASFGRAFASAVKAQGPFDAVVTFNRLPGGDLYFAADNCLAAEWRETHPRWMLHLIPRYRSFLKQEEAVCLDPKCRIMTITPRQKTQYQQAYAIPDDRFCALPPGMNPACRRPANAPDVRKAIRDSLRLTETDLMLLQVGSDFRRKGADRTIRAAASLPEALRSRVKVFLVGNCSPCGCDRLAASLGLADQVVFLGGRNDVPALLLGADLMIHPARSESAGSVLIEGLAAGLPVIASGLCGFANYVAEADPALVTPEPFVQKDLDLAVKNALNRLSELKQRTCEYGAQADFYRRAEAAVSLMEECGREGAAPA